MRSILLALNLAALLIVVGTIAPVKAARALTYVDGTTGDDFLVVGVTSIDSRVRWCRDSPGSGSDTWGYLSANSTLGDSVVIRGRPGNDQIWIIRGTTYVSGYCAGVYNGPLYGGYYLDAVGEDGDDAIYSGSGNSAVAGGAGNDDIYLYNSINIAYGGDGDDDMVGRAGSNEKLFGDAGSDCLEDDSGSFAWLNGGSNIGTLDYWRYGVCLTCPWPNVCPPICSPADGSTCDYPEGCNNTEAIWGGVGGGTCF